MCTQKMRALSYIGAEKITFPPKPDRQKYRQTYRRTDISVYRVASLLITKIGPPLPLFLLFKKRGVEFSGRHAFFLKQDI